jgi:hypothetical protein
MFLVGTLQFQGLLHNSISIYFYGKTIFFNENVTMLLLIIMCQDHKGCQEILLCAAIFLFVSRNRITLVNLDFGKCGNEMLLE